MSLITRPLETSTSAFQHPTSIPTGQDSKKQAKEILRRISDPLELDPYTFSKRRSPTVSRISSPLPQKNVVSQDHFEVENKRLIESASKLSELSQSTFHLPFLGDHTYDVYKIEFKNNQLMDVVFKPGLHAAIRSEVCYGLAQIIQVSNALVPSMAGTASVIASQDMNRSYRKLYTNDNHPLLIDQKDLTAISPPQVKENGKILCQISEKFFLLEPDGAFVKQAYPLSDLEVKLMDSNQFELLSSNKKTEFYLVPCSKIYSIVEKNNIDYVHINGLFYKLKEDDCRRIKLELVSRLQLNEGKTADHKILENFFSKFDQEDPENKEEFYEVLVPDNEYLYVDEMNETKKEISFHREGKAFKAFSIPNGSYQVEVEEIKRRDNSKRFLIVHNQDETQFFLVPKNKCQKILVEEDKEFVLRAGQKYSVEATDNDQYRVIGRNVKGMIQKLVTNIFIGHKKKSLDIRSENTERDLFYGEIDREHFIESFLMTILLRPQDGKITDLRQSNILFPKLESSKLGCVLIDLDETLPPQNQFSLQPDFLKNKKERVHIVRNGLMGFPQARSLLSKSEREQIISFIEKADSKKRDIQAFLHTFLSKDGNEVNWNQDHISATLEIIQRMKNFLEENKDTINWTLEKLFFFVFPEYQTHWDLLRTEPPELKASRVGLESAESLAIERKSSFQSVSSMNDSESLERKLSFNTSISHYSSEEVFSGSNFSDDDLSEESQD